MCNFRSSRTQDCPLDTNTHNEACNIRRGLKKDRNYIRNKKERGRDQLLKEASLVK